MDRPAAHAHRVHHRQARRRQVVAIADPAGVAPADRESKVRTAVPHQPEQGALPRIHRLGRAGEVAVEVNRHLVRGGDPGDQRIDRMAGGVLPGMIGRPHIEAQHRQIGHDVVGAAAVDPCRVDRNTGQVEPGQTQRKVRRRDQRIAALFRVAPGMGGAAAHHRGEIAAALARAGQGAIGQGRFEGQRGAHPPGRLEQQGCRAGGRDFLVAVDHHFPADRGGEGRSLQRAERGVHHHQPALHVGHARAIDRGRIDPAAGLEGILGTEHRVHVPGQQHAHGGLGADRQMEIAPQGQRHRLARGGHRVDRGGIAQRDRAERAEQAGEPIRHRAQPGQIAAARIDLGQGQDLRQHGLTLIDQPVQGLALAGRQAQGRGPIQASSAS